MRSAGSGGASGAGPGAARGSLGAGARAKAGPGPSRKEETPKEAVARRKREAADRQVAELKVAAKQAEQNKMVARQMKETEFQSTSFGPSAMSAAAAAASARPRRTSGARGGALASPGGSTADPSQATSRDDDDEDSGSFTPEEDDLDSLLEEISEEYTEDGSEYEDDFVSEDDSEPPAGSDIEEALAPHFSADASAVREEQDFTRVIANYEQDISRTRSGSSPTRRSSERPSPSAGPGATMGPAASVPGGFGGQIMDMKSRAVKLREELVAKMGPETFQKSFDYLSKARAKNVDEKTVRRELEALVGRNTYKRYCFDVDQLVFQQMLHP